MATTLTIRDETATGKDAFEFSLDFLTERITVQELIRSRVFQEVKDYNAKLPEYYRGLVQPTDTERTLNGYRMRKRRQIDWQKQYELALESFRHNGFIIMVDERQVGELDQEIEIRANTSINFLKLVPLVGG